MIATFLFQCFIYFIGCCFELFSHKVSNTPRNTKKEIKVQLLLMDSVDLI